MAPTRICVFCGSSAGQSAVHLTAARSLAQILHKNSVDVIYGGGTTGIMGELAKTLVALSGKESVHGIIPSSMLSLERPDKNNHTSLPRNWSRRIGLGGSSKRKEAEVLDEQFGRVTIVKDLQARKKMMMELVKEGGEGSGFIALSGGFGTLDEVMEVVSWRQMGIHDRGIVLFNVEGFWDGVINWVERAIRDGFIGERGKNIVVEQDNAESALEWLRRGKSAGKDKERMKKEGKK